MALIGILGGMGPLATVDFLERVIQLTAGRDAATRNTCRCWSRTCRTSPDRSRPILDGGADPLPALLRRHRPAQPQRGRPDRDSLQFGAPLV